MKTRTYDSTVALREIRGDMALIVARMNTTERGQTTFETLRNEIGRVAEAVGALTRIVAEVQRPEPVPETER